MSTQKTLHFQVGPKVDYEDMVMYCQALRAALLAYGRCVTGKNCQLTVNQDDDSKEDVTVELDGPGIATRSAGPSEEVALAELLGMLSREIKIIDGIPTRVLVASPVDPAPEAP